MTKPYLVAVDGSDHGWKALDLASAIAAQRGAELHVMHVIPLESLSDDYSEWAKMEGIPVHQIEEHFKASRAQGDKIIEEAKERLKNLDAPKPKTNVVMGHPANQIILQANNIQCEMVFLGSRGLSDFEGLLIGSVSHRVSSLANCTCVIVK